MIENIKETEETEEYNYIENVRLNDSIYKVCKEIKNIQEYLYDLRLSSKEIRATSKSPFGNMRMNRSFIYKNIIFFISDDRIVVGATQNKKQIIFFDCKYGEYKVISNLLNSSQIKKLIEITNEIKMILLDTKKEEINEFFKKN